jgi:hypothetical protein
MLSGLGVVIEKSAGVFAVLAPLSVNGMLVVSVVAPACSTVTVKVVTFSFTLCVAAVKYTFGRVV